MCGFNREGTSRRAYGIRAGRGAFPPWSNACRRMGSAMNNVETMEPAGAPSGGHEVAPQIEIWGGPECSFVRIGDRVADQFERSGHHSRLEDLDLFASLGIRALRYPISWERFAAGRIDWDWVAARLGRLRELGVRPIVRFVHHGGGAHPDGLLSTD